MSDTPRTDAVKIACGFQAVPEPMLQHAYKLERENAALRADVYCCPPTTENDYEGFKWRHAHEELERENAALRANSKEVFEYEAQMEELKSENAMLKAWKESALINEKELDAPATAKLLGVKLGESFYKTIAEKVPQLVAENAALRSELAEVKKAFAPIFVRELHGECIMLERENAALRELLHRSLHWLDDYDSRLSGSAKIADDIKEVLRKEAQP